MKNFANKAINFYSTLPSTLPLPEGIELLYPYTQNETRRVVKLFFEKFYNDTEDRGLLLGINPGRLGGGITGIGFCDAHHLEAVCGIPNNFTYRSEVSATFIFEVIAAYGGAKKFYGDFFVGSTSPLGFVKEGKNYNYYDSKALLESVEPFILSTLKAQQALGLRKKGIVCIGQGKNLAYLEALNDKHSLFEAIYTVPHPRWVMQYQKKHKARHIDTYLEVLSKIV